jgi:arginyl-tRNA synthetase
MSAVVRELIQSGVATKNEDESVGIVFDNSMQNTKNKIQNEGMVGSGNLSTQALKHSSTAKLPSCILQKRDGTHGYLASDLAAIKYRLRNWNPSKIIYFVDNRQALHFKQLFATAEKAWFSETGMDSTSRTSSLAGMTGKCEFIHAANGFVSLPEGAMSTRHGRVIFLSDVVEESFDRVKAILLERGKELADSDIRAVALGAIIYSFMAQDRERDWVFEWDKVLAFEGSSGPYLQYTYVRFAKMLQEFGHDKSATTLPSTLPLTSYDKELVLDILGFEDVLAQCAETYKFHLLIAHITTTARHLNALYVNTPKLRDSSPEERATRMQIIAQTLEMIRYSCEIVSIPLPREM